MRTRMIRSSAANLPPKPGHAHGLIVLLGRERRLKRMRWHARLGATVRPAISRHRRSSRNDLRYPRHCILVQEPSVEYSARRGNHSHASLPCALRWLRRICR